MPRAKALPTIDPRTQYRTYGGSRYRLAEIGHRGQWAVWGDGVMIGYPTTYEDARNTLDVVAPAGAPAGAK